MKWNLPRFVVVGDTADIFLDGINQTRMEHLLTVVYLLYYLKIS